MATLNVKDLPDGLYRKLKARAKRQRRSIAQEVITILAGELRSDERRSLLELKGLGKEVWRELDAAEYVDRERRDWA